MGYSEKHNLEEADSLFKQNDPRCIELYSRDNSNRAKNKLAMIYLKGKCGQAKDVKKALSYTKNNTNYGARAIEAHINIFEIGCSISEMQAYLLELIDIHEQIPTHTCINRVLASIYLQGKGIPINFAKAVEINPKLLEQKVFNKAVTNMSSDTRRNLFDHILLQKNDAWRNLVNESQREYKDEVRQKQIDEYLSKGQWKELADKVIEWFSDDENVESAYRVLHYALNRLSNEAYTRASDNLETGPDTDRNIGCIIESARLREDWPRVEKWLLSERTNDSKYDYERGYLEKHRGNIREACNYFIKSVHRNPKKGEYTKKSYDAIRQAFSLDPCLVIWKNEYVNLLLSRNDPKSMYVVGRAFCECGDQHCKTKGVNLLRQIAGSYYFAASTLYNITGEQQYAGMSKRLEYTGKRLNDYFFDVKDSTDVIETYYHGLPPYYAIKALDELADRYLRGKRNTPCDYEIAKMYLLEEIELCEKYHTVAKYAQAKLGLMMAEGKIECTDDEAMFESIYQLKDNPTYTCAVARCLIEGIGTERNVEEGTCLLLSADSPRILRELLRVNKEGRIDSLDKSVVLDLLRQILGITTPHPDEIELLRTISQDVSDQTTEIPYSRYQNSKIRALKEIANSKNDDPHDAIRYWDFARRCGDNMGAIRVAMIALNRHNQKLAYSILKTSDIDPQDPLHLKIKPENQTLINVDEELTKMMLSP